MNRKSQNSASLGGQEKTAGDYRVLLRASFEERCRANPRYSLRAFARDLGLAPSRLSEILHGKQGLSRDRAREVATRLGLSAAEASQFCDHVEAQDGRSKKTREVARKRIDAASSLLRFEELDQDAFRVISDWYHFAILELTDTRGFKSDPPWIARRLGISIAEVELAVERLERLGLLERRAGKLRQTGKSLTTTNGIPSEAIRKFNRQILEKAQASISLQTTEERDLSTLTVAIDPEDLPEVKEMIKGFRRKMLAFFQETEKLHRRSRSKRTGGARDANRGVAQAAGHVSVSGENRGLSHPAEFANRAAAPVAKEVYSLAIQFFRLTNQENL